MILDSERERIVGFLEAGYEAIDESRRHFEFGPPNERRIRFRFPNWAVLQWRIHPTAEPETRTAQSAIGPLLRYPANSID